MHRCLAPEDLEAITLSKVRSRLRKQEKGRKLGLIHGAFVEVVDEGTDDDLSLPHISVFPSPNPCPHRRGRDVQPSEVRGRVRATQRSQPRSIQAEEETPGDG